MQTYLAVAVGIRASVKQPAARDLVDGASSAELVMDDSVAPGTPQVLLATESLARHGGGCSGGMI